MFFRAFIFILALGFSSNVFFYHSASALDALPDNNSSFTHTLELKPIPHNYQMAKATFLPDRYDDLGLSDYDSIKSIQPDRNCESYTLSSCPSGGLCERCPFDVRKFRAYACTAPYLMSNGDCVCPAETPLIYPNDKCTQYCGSRCIQKTCTPSADKTGCTNSTQNCDNGCGQNTRKCCVPCTHKITSKPANSSYTYSSCTDDDGAKQIQTGWKCDPGYHERNGGCEKDCIANSCSGYTLATCPANATCSSCTKETTGCDGGNTVFQKTGCASGYKDCNGSCIPSSECCGGCASNQKCSNGTCVAACSADSCSGYTLNSCPANSYCSQCRIVNSDCSQGSYRYNLKGYFDLKYTTITCEDAGWGNGFVICNGDADCQCFNASGARLKNQRIYSTQDDSSESEGTRNMEALLKDICYLECSGLF